MFEYYDYEDWIQWPRDDVIEYAGEIASIHSLSDSTTRFLTDKMLEQAGHFWLPLPPPKQGPLIMGEEMLATAREMGQTEGEIFQSNVNLNKPWRSNVKVGKALRKVEHKVVGDGISQKIFSTYRWETPWAKEEKKRTRKHFASNPFRILDFDIRRSCDRAFWRANAYPIGQDDWITPQRHDEPYSGLLWYVAEIWRRQDNANKQAELGNNSGAMWHAFHLGQLCQELEVRLAHGRIFSKAQATRRAQSDAAKARKRIPDQLRRDTYWRFRKEGNKRVESGNLAAKELGLSEPSIRNAFPDGKYPAD